MQQFGFLQIRENIAHEWRQLRVQCLEERAGNSGLGLKYNISKLQLYHHPQPHIDIEEHIFFFNLWNNPVIRGLNHLMNLRLHFTD